MLPDLGWGFQSNRSSGTRSKVLRAPSVSWSNSGNKASLMDISLHLRGPAAPGTLSAEPVLRQNLSKIGKGVNR